MAEVVEQMPFTTLPLPITVICELLGVPVQRRAEFHDWSSIAVTGVLAGPDALVAAITVLVSYLQELGTLLTRFPRLRLAVPAEQLTRRSGVLINGLNALPVLLR